MTGYNRSCGYQYCRWCGKAYHVGKYLPEGGFCCDKHRQAHHRAYKKYAEKTDRR